jgi:hypothetical protein
MSDRARMKLQTVPVGASPDVLADVHAKNLIVLRDWIAERTAQIEALLEQITTFQDAAAVCEDWLREAREMAERSRVVTELN